MNKNMVDVLIPLYKPGGELFTMIARLKEQTVKPNRIILINTEKKYFDQLVSGTDFLQQYGDLVSVYHIEKCDFDHGKTRHLAVTKSNASIFMMMTQDALPADQYLIENLLKPLSDENTVVAYARQLPAEDCNVIEKYTRKFNYPDKSRVKTQKDLIELGIKTYFCSNVCAAYKRSAYDKQGGFIRHTIFNEDMIYAAGAIKSGYAIAYAAEARVIHSHNYTCVQQFKRNFDLGVSQADNPHIFDGVPSEKEGKKMVGMTIRYLRMNHYIHLIPGYILHCICRYMGYVLGKHYKRLPMFIIKKCTSSPAYWQ